MSVDIKNNVEKDSTCWTCCCFLSLKGWPSNFPPKHLELPVASYLLIELVYIGIPVVRTGVRLPDYQDFSDGLPNFPRYGSFACACCSAITKAGSFLDFYKAFKNRLLGLLVLYTPNSRFRYPSMSLNS